ncbi:MAG TPA: hypothetical protein EYG54_01195, partial [Myxococcales bacterium]|nr:hypothetical protein [Myxococcales bacterium]
MTLIVFGFLALYCFTRLEITNSITHFIPKQNEAELVDLSLKLVESPLAQRMLISVSGGSNSEQVADELREVIKLHPEVDWVEAEFDPAAMRKLYDVYFDRRMYMLSSEPRVEIPMLLQPESLAERADLLKRRLSQPGSMLLARGA